MAAVGTRTLASLAVAVLATPLLTLAALADDWSIAKSSGQVWLASPKAQPAALGKATKLVPGDLVQTGPTGRVLLSRGEERILIGPNSVVSLPATQKKPGFTTILQQAGSVAVEAEKKDHQHFEVLTPYLAAVVKGTQFTVTIGPRSANVDVNRGRVEVADLKSGQVAMVLPGQFARTGDSGSGLTLGGSGTFEPIQKGTPRASTLAPVEVPKSGLAKPLKTAGIAAVKPVRATAHFGHDLNGGGVRITRAIGAATLDIKAATAGLMRNHGPDVSAGKRGSPSKNETIWSANASNAGVSGNTASNGKANGVGNSAGNGLGNGVGNGLGNGLGNSASTGNGAGNGLALGLGNGNGNGFANGLGNGLGNGFGINNGVGNGKGKGNGKGNNN